jgi:hypothetical protein
MMHPAAGRLHPTTALSECAKCKSFLSISSHSTYVLNFSSLRLSGPSAFFRRQYSRNSVTEASSWGYAKQPRDKTQLIAATFGILRKLPRYPG